MRKIGYEKKIRENERRELGFSSKFNFLINYYFILLTNIDDDNLSSAEKLSSRVVVGFGF